MAEVLAFFLYVLAEVGLVETCSDLLQLVEPMTTTKTTEVTIMYLLVKLERCFPRVVLKQRPSLLFIALLLSLTTAFKLKIFSSLLTFLKNERTLTNVARLVVGNKAFLLKEGCFFILSFGKQTKKIFQVFRERS